MPTYEYLCQTCSHRFDVWQKMTDEPLQTCPECGNHIRRVLYPAGIVFKGSGFYKTDHGHGSGPIASNGEPSNGKKEPSETPVSTNNAEGSKTAESGTSPTKATESNSSSTSKVPSTTAAQS